MTIVIVFWIATALVVYAYVGYPLVLRLFRPRRPPSAPRSSSPPSLSVIIAAFNEARVIDAKLASTLGQAWPRDRIEVIVVSDGSTDGTDRLVSSHPDPRVVLVRQEPRAGKSAALNRGVAAASGDILVFTDANALFAPGALARLAAPFRDPRVGLVTGHGLYIGGTADDARAVASGYVRYEALIKTGESALGFVASADGAIYALRRDLYRDLAPAEVNDLLHPITAVLAGYECRFDPDAYTVEPPSAGAGQEFRRHVRIIAQGWHLLWRELPPLVAARRWRAVAMLLSHRVLRWTSAFWLLAALGTNLALLGRSPLYSLTLTAQLAFYLTALVGLVAERLEAPLGRLAIPYYFCVVSAAGLTGLVRAVKGRADAVWAPTSEAVSERAA